MSTSPQNTQQPSGDEPPEVPWLRTWPGVYRFVLISFLVIVGCLAWFTWVFRE